MDQSLENIANESAVREENGLQVLEKSRKFRDHLTASYNDVKDSVAAAKDTFIGAYQRLCEQIGDALEGLVSLNNHQRAALSSGLAITMLAYPAIIRGEGPDVEELYGPIENCSRLVFPDNNLVRAYIHDVLESEGAIQGGWFGGLSFVHEPGGPFGVGDTVVVYFEDSDGIFRPADNIYELQGCNPQCVHMITMSVDCYQGVQDEMTPDVTSQYLRAWPNPSNGMTQIEYSVPDDVELKAVPVKLEIFNPLGQRIRILVDKTHFVGGKYGSSWDGADMDGNPLASGIYFTRAEIGPKVMTDKIVLQR
ncbi:MAG: hypothetical protein KJ709_03460 [Nanoarchaeota archaeon]|nr:hypothetical protein [Nanoarchaeota archaeon]